MTYLQEVQLGDRAYINNDLKTNEIVARGVLRIERTSNTGLV